MTTTSPNIRASYEDRRDKLLHAFQALKRQGCTPRLGKRTSNLFRVREPAAANRSLDVQDFNHVIAVDRDRQIAEVEGMTPYETLVDATLARGMMPTVVPELKSITMGGAVTGGGIESSSFRYGFVHETVVAIEVLTGEGSTVIARPDNEHADLFHGFPNSYGTLGYALRLWIKLVPVRSHVRLQHTRYEKPEQFFKALEEVCRAERARADGAAFVDGVFFQENEMVLSQGWFTDEENERPSRYTFMRIYYQSIRRKSKDLLATRDYIWRWDTDWFWCARAFGMENPVLRFLFGLCGLLKSTTYWKIRNWNERWNVAQRLGLMRNVEWVIQDVEIPVDNAAAFLRFLDSEIGIRPVWICPAQAYSSEAVYPLYQTNPETLYINFGFWGGVKSTHPDGHYNRVIEQEVSRLEGKKSLYSSSYFPEEEFWAQYNQSAYEALKKRYDPDSTFPDLYTKCVAGRQ